MELLNILGGVALFIITSAIAILAKEFIKWRKRKKHMAEQVEENTTDILAIKSELLEFKQLMILIHGMTTILGDGMVQSGVNGDVKKAFEQKKQDVLKFL